MNPDHINFSDQFGGRQPSRMQLLSQMQAALALQNEQGNANQFRGHMPSLGQMNSATNQRGLSALQQRLVLEEERRLRNTAQAQVDRLNMSGGSDTRLNQYLDIGLANQFQQRRMSGSIGRDFMMSTQSKRRKMSMDQSTCSKLAPALLRGHQTSWAKTGPAAHKMPLPSRRSSGRRMKTASLSSYRKAWEVLSIRSKYLSPPPSSEERRALVNELFSTAIQFGKIGLYNEEYPAMSQFGAR
jgi:hypothetical protein